VAVRFDNLRREILRRATKSIRHFTVFRLLDLRQAEVGKFKVALRVQQHVFGLQIPVDNVVIMKMLESKGHLGGIETCTFLCEAHILAQVEEQLTAVQEVRHKVKRLGRLKGVVELDDKRMSDLLHNVSFNLGVVDLVSFDNEVLLERLNGVDLPTILLTCHVHFAERATPNDLQ